MKETDYTELRKKVQHELGKCAEHDRRGTAMYVLVQTLIPELSPHQVIQLVDMAECMKNAPGSGNSNQAHS